jgi:serine/threonine protein kinase
MIKKPLDWSPRDIDGGRPKFVVKTAEQKQQLVSFFDELSEELEQESFLLDSIETDGPRYVERHHFEEGGSKIIYSAFDTMTGRRVAYATPKDDVSPAQIDAFIREARITAMLQHPAIVPVYDFGVDDEQPFFSMKFVAGLSLKEIVDGIGKGDEELSRLYPLAARIDVFLKICDAVAYAHAHGILHLDLKPDNVRVDRFGEVSVCDWGLAQVIDGCDELHEEFGGLEHYSVNAQDTKHVTLNGYAKGTPGYMSPEQTGKTTNRKGVPSDVYSLGAILYSLLCFRSPFEGDAITVFEKTIAGDFERPSSICPTVPKSLEAICLKAMTTDPEGRYLSVGELRDDVIAYRDGYVTGAEEATFWKTLTSLIKRNRATSLVFAGSLLFIVALSTVYVSELKKKEETAVAERQTAVTERDRAREALELYDAERQRRQYLSDLGVDFFIKQAKQYVVFHSFTEAERVIGQIPDSEFTPAQRLQVRELFGRIAFYRQQYHKAADRLADCTDKDSKFLLAMARKYRDRKASDDVLLSGDEFVSLLDELEGFNIQHVWSSYEYELRHYPDVHEHMKVLEKMIHVKNNGIDKLNIELTERDGKYYLDLSGNPGMHSAVGVRFMPLSGIDFSGSGIQDFRMAILKDLPIEELNLAGCGLTNYNFIPHYKKLKRITVNEKEAKHPSLLHFGKHLEIIVQK